MAGETDLGRLIESMRPELDPTPMAFCCVSDPEPYLAARPWAVIREDEGWTLVLERDQALRLGLEPGPAFRRITLRVFSSLEAVGLTAAFSAALARKGISANVVAGFHHDHVFVPADRADDAMAALEALSSGGA